MPTRYERLLELSSLNWEMQARRNVFAAGSRAASNLSANALEKALCVDIRNELGNPLGLDEGIPIETQSKMAGCNSWRNRAARLGGNTAAPCGGEAGGTLFEANPRSCRPL